MSHLPAGSRTHTPEQLGHLRELTIERLGDLLAQLDAGTLDFVDASTVTSRDEKGRSTGVITYTTIVRKPARAP